MSEKTTTLNPSVQAAPPAPVAGGLRLRRHVSAHWRTWAQRYGALASLVVLFLYNAVATPFFLTRESLLFVLLRQAAPVAIVAVGMAIVRRFVEALGIKCSSSDQPVRELSGGNQQKVILARWLCTEPRLLILDEPTRGIDVGAKRDIQILIRDLADDGVGVLFISSELEEVVACCDRVVTLRDGTTVAELTGDEISEGALMAAMATGSAAADAA